MSAVTQVQRASGAGGFAQGWKWLPASLKMLQGATPPCSSRSGLQHHSPPFLPDDENWQSSGAGNYLTDQAGRLSLTPFLFMQMHQHPHIPMNQGKLLTWGRHLSVARKFATPHYILIAFFCFLHKLAWEPSFPLDLNWDFWERIWVLHHFWPFFFWVPILVLQPSAILTSLTDSDLYFQKWRAYWAYPMLHDEAMEQVSALLLRWDFSRSFFGHLQKKIYMILWLQE